EVLKTSEIELPNEATKTSPPQEYWRSQAVVCKITKTLKGRRIDSLIFRQHYSREQRDPPIDDRPLQPGDKILLFAVEKPMHHDQKVMLWVNLTKPDVASATSHAPYNNDCKWLAGGDAVIGAVQAEIDLERKTGRSKQRGLIVWFTATPHQGLYWDF